uniref:TPR_REGION domain-containing protein n=1 Tax=Parascaris equorum TaxID=6256 RepID=A0A914RUZ7_PAREQ
METGKLCMWVAMWMNVSRSCRVQQCELLFEAAGFYPSEKALMDARKAIAMDPFSIKGRYRHAMALINLELYEMAFDDLEKILEIDPNNKETQKMKEAIKDKANARFFGFHLHLLIIGT